MSDASRTRTLNMLMALAIDLQSERLRCVDQIAEIDSELRIISQLADAIGGTPPSPPAPEMDVWAGVGDGTGKIPPID